MSFSMSRKQGIYLQSQAKDTLRTIPNSNGAATVTGSDACLVTRAVCTPAVDPLRRNDKTGTRTARPSKAGRCGGTWSIGMDLAASGTPGTPGDCEPILAALFGKAGQPTAGTKVQYALTDDILGFVLWNYIMAGFIQQTAFGCVVARARFNFNEAGPATWTAEGTCVGVLDSVQYPKLADGDVGKGGLTTAGQAAFPAEPNTPTVTGDIVAGFTGSITVGTDSLATLRSANLDIATGNALVTPFGSYYADASGEGDERQVNFTFSVDEANDAAHRNLMDVALSQTPVDITVVAGAVAGNIWTFPLKQVVLAVPARNDSQRRWGLDIAASRAHGSSLTALDEVALTIT